MKLILALTAIVMFSVWGFIKSKKLSDRVKALQTVRIFLEKLKAYLRFERLTTPQIFSKLSDAKELSELSFISECAKKLEQNPNFPKAWGEALDNYKKEEVLSDEDIRELYLLGGFVGSTDIEGQLNGINLVDEQVLLKLNDADENYNVKGKLYRSLGVALGLALGVIII